MGNWSGTVRCSVCYKSGHNKRSCPVETARLEGQLKRFRTRMAEVEKLGTDSTSYENSVNSLADQIARRTGVHPITGTVLPKGQRGPKRRCSYCKHKVGWSDGKTGIGHTRRTCATLKADIARAHDVNRAYRKAVLDSLRAAGVAHGALLKVSVTGYFKGLWERRDALHMVRTIEWSEINYTSPGEPVILARIDCLGSPSEGRHTVKIPHYHVERQDGSASVAARFDDTLGALSDTTGSTLGGWDPQNEKVGWRSHVIVSGVSGEKISPPAWWLTEESPHIIAHFRTLKG